MLCVFCFTFLNHFLTILFCWLFTIEKLILNIFEHRFRAVEIKYFTVRIFCFVTFDRFNIVGTVNYALSFCDEWRFLYEKRCKNVKIKINYCCFFNIFFYYLFIIRFLVYFLFLINIISYRTLIICLPVRLATITTNLYVN